MTDTVTQEKELLFTVEVIEHDRGTTVNLLDFDPDRPNRRPFLLHSRTLLNVEKAEAYTTVVGDYSRANDLRTYTDASDLDALVPVYAQSEPTL